MYMYNETCLVSLSLCIMHGYEEPSTKIVKLHIPASRIQALGQG